MYTATVLINIANFVPLGSGNIAANLGTPIDTSPGAPTGVFSGTGEQLMITTPDGYTGGVQVTFQLPGSDFVLVGIAVDPAQSEGKTGRQEFRTVTINRDPSGSQLTVTDACVPQFYGVNFSYVILVQQAGTPLIGQIDPDEENEPQ